MIDSLYKHIKIDCTDIIFLRMFIFQSELSKEELEE